LTYSIANEINKLGIFDPILGISDNTVNKIGNFGSNLTNQIMNSPIERIGALLKLSGVPAKRETAIQAYESHFSIMLPDYSDSETPSILY